MSAQRISAIFHPSDFSAASEVAFAHALRIALATHASLNMLHVEPERLVSWREFPAVRGTLERWGLIAANSPKRAVIDLGIDVVKVVSASGRTIPACRKFLKQRPADLIVLAVHQREGHVRWLGARTGEPLVRRAGEMALFIPHGVSGFVSLADGSVTLRRILIPIAHSPAAQPAIDAVVRLVEGLGQSGGQVLLLHAGSIAKLPKISIPKGTAWSWQVKLAEGEAVDAIVKVANEECVDLIAMTTEGSHGFLDALRGSTSEQVLSKVGCALACLPARAAAPRAFKAAHKRSLNVAVQPTA